MQAIQIPDPSFNALHTTVRGPSAHRSVVPVLTLAHPRAPDGAPTPTLPAAPAVAAAPWDLCEPARAPLGDLCAELALVSVQRGDGALRLGLLEGFLRQVWHVRTTYVRAAMGRRAL